MDTNPNGSEKICSCGEPRGQESKDSRPLGSKGRLRAAPQDQIVAMPQVDEATPVLGRHVATFDPDEA